MGYLPEAMRNYLARLGWSHGNDEFFTTEQAIAWFDLSHLGKAPARFDFAKLETSPASTSAPPTTRRCCAEVEAFLAAQKKPPLTETERAQMLRAMPGLKERAKTLPQILDMASFILLTTAVRDRRCGGERAGFGAGGSTGKIDFAPAKR